MRVFTNIMLTLFIIVMLMFIYFNYESISNYFISLVTNKEIIIKESNEYKRKYSYISFSNNETFIPINEQQILNIYYNILNNGWDTFTFYCPEEYATCIEDVQSISNNKTILSDINNYVNPYNSFYEINTLISSNGEISVVVTKNYNNDEINAINSKMFSIIDELNLKNKSDVEKIKLVHDYIIKNVIYDSNFSDSKSNYDSTTAYGALMEGYAVCSGYSDAFSLFMDYLNIPNLKISSENHVWNLVYINNKWQHVDTTWDDNDKTNTTHTNFLLINTEKLLQLDQEEHTFNQNFYKEAIW